MRKLLSITLVLVLALTLFAGCAGKPATSAAPSAAAPSSAAPAPGSAAPSGSEAPSAAPTKEALDFTDAKKVNLQFAIYLADADKTTKDCVRYLDMIKEATQGTVDYTLYAGGTLAPGDQELDAVKNGLADIAFFPTAYGSGNMPEGFMLEYPGVNFTNGKAASYTVNDWFNQVQPKELADFKLLYALGQGNGCIMTTFPVEKFEDLAGKQIRCAGSMAPIVTAYGATPTVMAFSEVYEGLRTGVVQGFYGLAHAGNSVKLYEVTKCAVKDPYYFGTYIMVMNKDVWNSLTEAQQTAITDVTAVAFDEFLAAGRDADAQAAFDTFKASGLTVVEFDQANLDKMIGATGYLQKDYAKELDGKGLKGSDNLTLFHTLADKYNAQYK